jgi:hypothetical protein
VDHGIRLTADPVADFDRGRDVGPGGAHAERDGGSALPWLTGTSEAEWEKQQGGKEQETHRGGKRRRDP